MKQPRLYQVRIDTYETASKLPYPDITHIFNGRTPQEAWHKHDAHRKTIDS